MTRTNVTPSSLIAGTRPKGLICSQASRQSYILYLVPLRSTVPHCLTSKYHSLFLSSFSLLLSNILSSCGTLNSLTNLPHFLRHAVHASERNSKRFANVVSNKHAKFNNKLKQEKKNDTIPQRIPVCEVRCKLSALYVISPESSYALSLNDALDALNLSDALRLAGPCSRGWLPKKNVVCP